MYFFITKRCWYAKKMNMTSLQYKNIHMLKLKGRIASSKTEKYMVREDYFLSAFSFYTLALFSVKEIKKEFTRSLILALLINCLLIYAGHKVRRFSYLSSQGEKRSHYWLIHTSFEDFLVKGGNVNMLFMGCIR